MDIIEALEWRYAVKKFDPSYTLTDKQIDRLAKALNLTATSMGMQLMECIIIQNSDLKKKITPIAFYQPQIEDCSHLIVLCRKDIVKPKHINEIVEITQDKRNIPLGQLEGYQKMLSSTLAMEPRKQAEWMENQVYIAMGNLLTVCAAEGIDACPMEGFNRDQLDEALNLEAKNLRSVLMCPVGKRSTEDKYNGLKKIRRPLEKTVWRLD
jgi:nitroreductase/dihydropteridine reductase